MYLQPLSVQNIPPVHPMDGPASFVSTGANSKWKTVERRGCTRQGWVGPVPELFFTGCGGFAVSMRYDTCIQTKTPLKACEMFDCSMTSVGESAKV